MQDARPSEHSHGVDESSSRELSNHSPSSLEYRCSKWNQVDPSSMMVAFQKPDSNCPLHEQNLHRLHWQDPSAENTRAAKRLD